MTFKVRVIYKHGRYADVSEFDTKDEAIQSAEETVFNDDMRDFKEVREVEVLEGDNVICRKC